MRRFTHDVCLCCMRTFLYDIRLCCTKSSRSMSLLNMKDSLTVYVYSLIVYVSVVCSMHVVVVCLL